jgi:hypothetical protein
VKDLDLDVRWLGPLSQRAAELIVDAALRLQYLLRRLRLRRKRIFSNITVQCYNEKGWNSSVWTVAGLGVKPSDDIPVVVWRDILDWPPKRF